MLVPSGDPLAVLNNRLGSALGITVRTFIHRKPLSNYYNGITFLSVTDARHDSTANAYHSTVPCLSGR